MIGLFFDGWSVVMSKALGWRCIRSNYSQLHNFIINSSIQSAFYIILCRFFSLLSVVVDDDDDVVDARKLFLFCLPIYLINSSTLFFCFSRIRSFCNDFLLKILFFLSLHFVPMTKRNYHYCIWNWNMKYGFDLSAQFSREKHMVRTWIRLKKKINVQNVSDSLLFFSNSVFFLPLIFMSWIAYLYRIFSNSKFYFDCLWIDFHC